MNCRTQVNVCVPAEDDLSLPLVPPLGLRPPPLGQPVQHPPHPLTQPPFLPIANNTHRALF